MLAIAEKEACFTSSDMSAERLALQVVMCEFTYNHQTSGPDMSEERLALQVLMCQCTGNYQTTGPLPSLFIYSLMYCKQENWAKFHRIIEFLRDPNAKMSRVLI